MEDILKRIKRAVIAGHYVFSRKARIEMEIDHLHQSDVVESILNAIAIYKKIRSTSTKKLTNKEFLYIILSTNLDGIPIYTKGKLVREKGQDTYYFLVSSKKAF